MPKKTPAELRSVLDDAGVTFADCVAAFAAPEGDIHVAAARAQCRHGDTEIADPSVVDPHDDLSGAYVLAWVRIDNPEFADGDSLAMPLDETPA